METGKTPRILLWLQKRSVVHSARSAVATTASLLFAQLFAMPEPYWACLTTMVVMQSTLGASWKVSRGRIIGTAMGSLAGGAMATWLHVTPVIFCLGIFGLGLLCAATKVDVNGFRFAGVALSIVTLISRTTVPPYVIAYRRFAEVCIGILMALVFSAIWPDIDED